MSFEKSILILTVGISSVLLTVSLQAAEKLQSMDAIWGSMGVPSATVRKKAKKAITSNLIAKISPQKIINPKQVKYTREQYQARYQNEQNLLKQRQKLAALIKLSKKPSTQMPISKLDRQRAAWREKWEADQKKVKGFKRETPQKHLAKQVSAKQQLALIALPKQARSVRKKTMPPAARKLTRAQYQWRWKQAQLKKPQNRNTLTPVSTPGANATYASFRKSNQKASFRKLPVDIVAKLRATGSRENGVSAYVQDVSSPRPLLAYQENTSRVPASVMKLITGYASLGTLGANYRWPLDVYTKGSIRNGTLQGDLIIKGYGSPEFKTADLRKVLQGIRQKGIRNVTGRVVFDSSYFNIPNQYSFDGKTQSKYNAQPDALLFNERVNTFQVRAVGKKVRVTTTTPTHNLKIVNKMRKTKRGCSPRIRVSKRGQRTVVTFSGRFSRRCGTRSYSRVISRPAEMIYGSMKSMWKRDVGGVLKTKFAMGRAPANARLLLRTHSRTLAEILPTIIKKSNNVMARQLLLTIGAKRTGQGTPRAGANAIGQWLTSRGLNFPELRIENGSGLSRTARISAAHVGDLLVDAYRSPYRDVFMRSLAIAGVDGTMKRRLKRTKVRGRGFFKTGTLRDVRSIAGYVKAANGKTYVMAILHNDRKARKRALRAHDKLIEWVYVGGKSNTRLAMR